MMDIVEHHLDRQEKVLIVSESLVIIGEINSRLTKKYGNNLTVAPSCIYEGKSTLPSRLLFVERVNKGSLPFAGIMSTRTCALGLNLPGACAMILIDHPCKCATSTVLGLPKC